MSTKPMLRRAILLAASLAAWPVGLVAQARAADSLAILDLVRQRSEAMRTLRVDLQGASYAPDAVWLNAFGGRRVGRDSIVAFLRRLYADPGYRDSRLIRENPPEILFVRPDVAVVHEYHEREGQRLSDGRVLDRRIHTTLVVSKETGRWLVRYQHISDERDRAAAR